MLLCLGLGACEKDVQLEGERIPVTVPLDASAPVDGKPAPALPAAPANRAVAISLPAPVSNGEWTHRGGSARHAGPDGYCLRHRNWCGAARWARAIRRKNRIVGRTGGVERPGFRDGCQDDSDGLQHRRARRCGRWT